MLSLAEPKIHVTAAEFKKTLAIAEATGFKVVGSPDIFFSHTAVLQKQ